MRPLRNSVRSRTPRKFNSLLVGEIEKLILQRLKTQSFSQKLESLAPNSPAYFSSSSSANVSVATATFFGRAFISPTLLRNFPSYSVYCGKPLIHMRRSLCAPHILGSSAHNNVISETKVTAIADLHSFSVSLDISVSTFISSLSTHHLQHSLMCYEHPVSVAFMTDLVPLRSPSLFTLYIFFKKKKGEAEMF